MEKINDSNFDEKIKKNSLVLVDFFAEWCPPCKMLEPVIEELAKEYEGKIAFFKMNVDENRETALRFGIMSIPTMIMFKNGNVVDKMIGAYPKHLIKERLEKLLRVEI
jgi:thioredoxin 1